jgi:hypothetical protein
MGRLGDLLSSASNRGQLGARDALMLGSSLIVFGLAIGGLVALAALALGLAGVSLRNWLLLSAFACVPLAVAWLFRR